MERTAPDHSPGPPPATPPATLPALLRTLRRGRRWTQDEAARAGGVSRVTLARWEGGAQTPRVPELERLLAGLDADPRARRRAVGMLHSPAALVWSGRETARAGLESLPGGGDLLRALRRRRGWSAAQAAAGAGVTAGTLRRWEGGDAWPPPARLHTLCWALGAHPEEVAALTVGEFAPGAPPPSSAPERRHALDHALDGLRQRVADGDTALIDLHCLSLQHRAAAGVAEDAAGQRGLSRAFQIHAMSLCFRGRMAEGKRQAERAMAVWPVGVEREPIWFYCGVLVAQGFSEGGSRWGARRGRETLDPLLDAVADRPGPAWGGLEVWMLSETALCLAQEGATDAALAVGERACRVAEARTGPAEVARRQSSLAGLLLTSGRPAAALSLLDGVPALNPYHAAEAALVRAEACLGMGSTPSAQDWLREARRLIGVHELSHLLPRADALAARG